MFVPCVHRCTVVLRLYFMVEHSVNEMKRNWHRESRFAVRGIARALSRIRVLRRKLRRARGAQSGSARASRVASPSAARLADRHACGASVAPPGFQTFLSPVGVLPRLSPSRRSGVAVGLGACLRHTTARVPASYQTSKAYTTYRSYLYLSRINIL